MGCNRVLNLSTRHSMYGFAEGQLSSALSDTSDATSPLPPVRTPTLRDSPEWLSYLPHAQTAIHIKYRAGDIAGFFAGEEYHGGGDFRVATHPAKRDAREERVLHILRKRIRHGRDDESGRDRVYGDVPRSNFER